MALPSPPDAYYVAADGSDSNVGSESSPFATVYKARDAIRALSTFPANGVKVYVRGGSYQYASVLTMDARDSGVSNARRVTYTPYPGEREQVFNTCAKDITSYWVDVSAGDSVYSRLPASTVSNVKYVDLQSRYGIYDYGSITDADDNDINQGGLPLPMELYFKGHRQLLARYPNWEGGIEDDVQQAIWELMTSASNNERAYYYRSRPSDMNYQMDSGNNFICTRCFDGGWSHGYDKVIAVNKTSKYFEVDRVTSYSDYDENERFFISNVVEELDTPGEYWIDRSTGRVYLYPSDTIGGDNKVYATLYDGFLYTNGTDYLTWDLPLRYCRKDAVVIRNGFYCTLKADIRGTGVAGARMIPISGGRDQHFYLATGKILDTGWTGLQIGGGYSKTLTNSMNRVYNFEGGHFARWMVSYCGGLETTTPNDSGSNRVCGGTYENIYIHHGPHLGIQTSNVLSTWRYIIIDEVGLEAADMGAVYYGRVWYVRGMKFEWGVIKNSRARYKYIDSAGVLQQTQFTYWVAKYFCGIYVDDGGTAPYIKGFVFEDIDWSVFFSGCKYGYIENCIFDDYSVGIHWPSKYYNTDLQKAINDNLPGTLTGHDADTWTRTDHWRPETTWGAQGTKFNTIAKLQALLDSGATEYRPQGTVKNCVFKVPDKDKWAGSSATKDWVDNFRTLSSCENSNLLENIADLGFYDASSNDYRLQEDAPAFDTGQMNPVFPQEWNTEIAKIGLVGYHDTGDVDWSVHPPLDPQTVDSFTGITGLLIEFKQFNAVSAANGLDTLYFFNCQDITIENTYIANSQKAALHFVGCSNITLRNNKIQTTGLGANANDQYAIIVEGPSAGDALNIVGNWFNDCDGNILIRDTEGIDNVAIRGNFCDGLTRRNTSGNDIQYALIQDSTGLTNFIAEDNVLYSPMGDGGTEIDDIIALDNSSGTETSPLHIVRNRVYGGDPSNTDKAGIRLNAVAHAKARHNILIDQPHVGILVEAGRGHEAVDNQIFTSQHHPQHSGGYGGLAVERVSTVNPGTMYDAAIFSNSIYCFRDGGLAPLVFPSDGLDDCTPNHGYCTVQTCDCTATVDPDNWDLGVDGNTTTVNNEGSYNDSAGYAGYDVLWKDAWSDIEYHGIDGYGGIPTQVLPAHGSLGVSLSEDQTLLWSNRVSTVIESVSLVRTLSGSPLIITTSATVNSLAITPDTGLVQGIDYTGHVVGAVYDEYGLLYPVDYTWSFSTSSDERFVDSSRHRHTVDRVSLEVNDPGTKVDADVKDSQHVHTSNVTVIPPAYVPPTGTAQKVFASTITVEDNGGSSVGSKEIVVIGSAVTEEQVHGYTRGVFEIRLLAGFSAVPRVGACIKIFERKYLSDGIALMPVPSSTHMQDVIAKIPVDLLGGTSQKLRESNVPINYNGAVYYLQWLDGEGGSASMNAAWSVKLTPYTYRP